MSDKEYLAIEAVLMDYIVSFGLTPAAREFFSQLPYENSEVRNGNWSEEDPD